MKNIVILLVLSVFTLSSCNYIEDNKSEWITLGDVKEILETTEEVSLDSTKWNFEDYKASLDFQDGRYAFSAWCNGIGWTYELTTDWIKFNPWMSTMMHCGDEIMDVENKLSNFLSVVNDFSYNNWKLVLNSESEEITLTKAVNTSLVWTKWSLSSILDWSWILSDISFKDSFIQFDSEWKMSWKAICNNMFWSFESTDSTININKVATTRMMCKPDTFSEFKLTTTLENVDSYIIERDVLTLLSKDWKFKVTYTLDK